MVEIVTIDDAIDDLYYGKLLDHDNEPPEGDRIKFYDQIHKDLKHLILNLSNLDIGINVLTKLPKIIRFIPKIRTLNLYGNLIGDGGMNNLSQIIQQAQKLTSLNIGCNDLTDGSTISIINIIKEKKIKNFQLGRTDNHTVQTNHFNIESLNAIIDNIAQQNFISTLGIAGLGTHKQKKLGAITDLSQRISNLVRDSTKLSTLDISNCDFSAIDIPNLASAFTPSSILRHLNISDNCILHTPQVISSIIQLEHLRYLNINNCKVSPKSCNVLSSRFKSNWGLISLNIGNNPIGPYAMLNFLESLIHNNTLVILNLSNTGIDKNDSNALEQLIEHHPTLSEIDLSRNIIGDEIINIFSQIDKQETITKLSLESCRITDNGAKSLANGLISNSTLIKLNLRDNFLSREFGYQIVQILQQNHTITKLEITSNQIDCFAIEAALTLTRRNRTTAREKMLEGMRKQYIALSIQRAKLPYAKKKLRTIMRKTNNLQEELEDLTLQYQTFDIESGTNLEISQKSVDDYESIIKKENEYLQEIYKNQKELKSITERELKELHEKIDSENLIRNKSIKAAELIEKGMQEFQHNSKAEKEKIKNDIDIVETLIRQVTEILGDPDTITQAIIPEYPFPDELSQTKKNNKMKKGNPKLLSTPQMPNLKHKKKRKKVIIDDSKSQSVLEPQITKPISMNKSFF